MKLHLCHLIELWELGGGSKGRIFLLLQLV